MKYKELKKQELKKDFKKNKNIKKIKIKNILELF